MKIREALIKATKKLSKSTPVRTTEVVQSGGSPSLDAEVLLSHVLDKPKEYLHINPEKKLSVKIEKQYFISIARRSHGWPVAYLTNKKDFFRLDFFVDKNVLIPRPETEGLVELVLKQIKDLRLRISAKGGSASGGKDHKPISILDVGTGSGCIIISLAKILELVSPPFKGELKRGSYQKHFKTSPSQPPAASEVGSISLKGGGYEYFASDISISALKIAKLNARKHKTSISFKQSDLLKAWKNQDFDVIVANLPYLAKRTDRSTKFEPTKALLAKNKGLAIYEELFKTLPSTLSPQPSFIFLEIGDDQGQAIKKLAEKYLPAFDTKISKDLSKRARFAVLEKSF